ncbi:DnaJ sub C member 7 [Podochytrium sp. JEL0797]|nr:DnaJ sub C member 7 [Podochytrium sp. JEL0797]
MVKAQELSGGQNMGSGHDAGFGRVPIICNGHQNEYYPVNYHATPLLRHQEPTWKYAFLVNAAIATEGKGKKLAFDMTPVPHFLPVMWGTETAPKEILESETIAELTRRLYELPALAEVRKVVPSEDMLGLELTNGAFYLLKREEELIAYSVNANPPLDLCLPPYLHSEALALRAQILYLNDSHPLVNVIQFLTQALNFDPDCKRARVFLKTIKALEAKKKKGNEAYGKQEWEAAELKYSEWLDLESVGGVVRCKVLSNRAMTSRHPECISDCKTAITLLTTLSFPSNPTSPPPEPTNKDLANTLQHALFLKLHLRRADSHLKLEEYTEALRDYQLCSEIDPENREIAAAVQNTKKAERAAKRKDCYKILGCPRDADEGAIKKAYRKIAIIYHPDKQAALPEEERTTCDSKFKEVAEAYSVLSDPQKKAVFDNGHDVDGASASGGGGGNPFGGGGMGDMDMEDIMRMFAQQQGGGGGYGGGHSHQRQSYGGGG